MNDIFEYSTKILESHLDSFGHVNNANYLKLFEEARWDFITKNGHGLDYVLEKKVGPIILDINLRFKHELKNRDEIRITSQVVEVKNSKIYVIEQKMMREDGKLAAHALFTAGFFDLTERKLIAPESSWVRALGIRS